MKAYLLIAAILLAGNSWAATDYQCANECQSKGRSYGYCKKECTYGESRDEYQPGGSYSPGGSTNSNTDYQCLNECTAKGSLYSYCKEKCAY